MPRVRLRNPKRFFRTVTDLFLGIIRQFSFKFKKRNARSFGRAFLFVMNRCFPSWNQIGSGRRGDRIFARIEGRSCDYQIDFLREFYYETYSINSRFDQRKKRSLPRRTSPEQEEGLKHHRFETGLFIYLLPVGLMAYFFGC